MAFSIDIKKKLSDFQLDVKLHSPEQIIAILGASGSGKSMLLRCIAGLVKPDEGEIVINGQTFFDSKKKINRSMRDRKVGFLFQNYALFPHLTIAENIAFGLDQLSRTEKNKRVNALIEKYHLGDIGKRYPAQISGGQQQRVALARAVAVEPDILLLDEPFSALDVHLRNHMMREMAEHLKEFQGLTLFVTHNREEAYRLADYIAVFNAGMVETYGQKDEVFNWPASLETAKITGCKNIVAAVRLAENRLQVPAWHISLSTVQKIGAQSGHLGIRANQIKLLDAPDTQRENCFQVWIADESDGPFQTSLYLKIGSQPESIHDFHLQCEISREKREKLTNCQEPFGIYINPEFVFFVEH